MHFSHVVILHIDCRYRKKSGLSSHVEVCYMVLALQIAVAGNYYRGLQEPA